MTIFDWALQQFYLLNVLTINLLIKPLTDH